MKQTNKQTNKQTRQRKEAEFCGIEKKTGGWFVQKIVCSKMYLFVNFFVLKTYVGVEIVENAGA